jgi:PKHD-type hydroxylase|tara:strand:- start:874 stop:1497 length:624 start_codon:yes stop_codon:yes gene_type:complete
MYKQNNDLKYSIQIPTFLSHEKCDELIKDIIESEQEVNGGVGGEDGRNTIIPEIRKTTEWYLCDQPTIESRPDKPNKDWKWLQDKIFQMANIVNDKVFHFEIKGCDDELKLIEYQDGGFYGWHTDFNVGSCSVRKIVGIIQLTDPSEYEGGEVQFGIQDKNTKEWYTMNQLKGSLTLFPSFLCHNVVPVTKGKRYVIQEIFVGDHFK